MHKISRIVVENFRACRKVDLSLTAYTPLVGQNNTGKSSILEALAWVLKPSTLAESDFQDPTQPVHVSACIEGITSELIERIPDPKHRTAIADFCVDQCLWIRAIASRTAKKKTEQRVWDPEKGLEDGIPLEWRPYPTGLPAAVSALLPEPLFVEALDDITEDLGKAKAGTTIKGLLDEIMEPLISAHSELEDALATIRGVLTTSGEDRSKYLKTFDESATEALEPFFPGLSLELDLQIVKLKEFFKAGDLHVTDQLTGDRRRFDQVGTGAQRSIQMALVRYLAEAREKAGQGRPSRRLLLIDEPEIYLHPRGVRRLRWALATLSERGFQVVFATHSPLMLTREDARDTIIVRKGAEDGVTTARPLRAAVERALDDGPSQARTLFELGNVAEIYFADVVVLCEGKTDRRLLPLAHERLHHGELGGADVAFVALGSCSDIPKALPVLRAMGIRACAVADLDFAFVQVRAGAQALLDKEGHDLKRAKAVLARLEGAGGLTLGNNGLPVADGPRGHRAADGWRQFALDLEGKAIVDEVRRDLMRHGIWVWSSGTIEDVTGHVEKGETAIVEQESILGAMQASEIRDCMAEFAEFDDWIESNGVL